MKIQKKIYLTITILVALLFSACFWIVKPLLANIKTKAQQLEEMQSISQNKEREEKFQKQLEKLRTQYQKISPQLNLLSQSLLDKEETVIFIESLESLAEKLGLTQEIQTSKKSTSPLFQISLIGEFPQVLKYIKALENLDYINQIKAFDLKQQKNKESQPTGKVRANLTVKMINNEDEDKD